MLDSSASLVPDDDALEFLVRRLTLDRSARVAASASALRSEMAQAKAARPARPARPEGPAAMGRPEGPAGPRASGLAKALSAALSAALNGGGGAEEWRAAEREWNGFLQASEALQRIKDAECTKEALGGLVTSATYALAPLLSALREASGTDENVRLARRLYSQVVSSIIRYDASFSSTGCGSDVWTVLYDRNAECYALLKPFIEGEVEPLEKELIFHFQKCSKTVHREEPQHFFSFVLSLYKRQAQHLQANGWMPPTGQAGISDMVSPSILAIGNVALALTVISLFRSSYEWHAGSETLKVMDYTIHGVNTFIDFLGATEGFLHRSAQRLLVESILPPSVFCFFLDAIHSSAEASFASGGRALWRMEFLYDGPTHSPLNFIRCKTQHMVRCLEAVVRRLSHVFCILPMYASSLWERVLGPCLSFYVSTMEDLKGKSNSRWEEVMTFLELLSCTHIIHSAADEWIDRCREVSRGQKNFFTSFDSLSLWRDALTREVAETIKDMLTQIFSGRGYLETDFHALNTVLDIFQRSNKTVAHTIVYEEIKLCMTRITTSEQRRQLLDYFHTVGMKNISFLVEEISSST